MSFLEVLRIIGIYECGVLSVTRNFIHLKFEAQARNPLQLQ